MASLIVKQLKEQNVELACYSERGIMSYFVFRVAVHKTEFCRFLRALQFPPGSATPFSKFDDANLSRLTAFSELEVGQRLGNPDGAFFFTLSGKNFFIWIQAKGNESYNESCSKTGSSSAKKQLDRLYETPRRYAQSPFDSSSDGVNKLFKEYVSRCQVEDNYFLLISNERNNPFAGHLQDRETPDEWKCNSAKFCWLDIRYLEESPGM